MEQGTTKTSQARAIIQTTRKQVTEHLQELVGLVDTQAADRGFRQLLNGMARLWRYSWLNQWWINHQRKGCTSVAGRHEWEARGRTVREGEKALTIAAPSNPGRGGWPFLLVEVFDISQTDGPLVPDMGLPCGETRLVDAVEAAAPRLKIDLELIPRALWRHGRRAGGISMGGRVEVVADLNPVARCGVLVHEYAHELLHHDVDVERVLGGKAVIETEAEAAAYVVLRALDLPGDSKTYIVWMGGSGKTVLKSFQRIQAAANAILTAINGKRPRVRIPKPATSLLIARDCSGKKSVNPDC